jgi:chromate transporter
MTAFGGPAAHIAMMQDTVVRRLAWLEPEAFLDLVGASAMIPGPNSTELAMHIGRRLAGWRGLIVAGVCFIAPSAVLVLACAAAYARYGQLPRVGAALAGVEPVVVAVVAQALWRLAPSALAPRRAAPIAAVAFSLFVVAPLAGIPVTAVMQIAVLAAAGVAGAVPRGTPRAAAMVGLGGTTGIATGIGVAAGAAAVGLVPLFLFFLGVGAVIYGSGYVLLAFLHGGLVVHHAWITDRQLLDAVAIGQITPGPVFTAATFVGYLVRGVPGAAVATVGIFFPAFVYVAASAPLLTRLRRSPRMAGFLDGVNAASLALLAATVVQIARTALVDPFTMAIAALSLVLVLRTTWNPVWFFIGGAVAGAVMR